MKTQNPKTNHAFLDTVAGKSAIPGSPGKHCRQSERNNQKKIAELHDWVFSFFSLFCLWNRGDVHCTAINTLYTRFGGEYLRRWVARSQAGHLLHNFCGSALRQPKLVHQPPPTTTNQHQPASTSTSTISRGYASAPLTLELLNPCSATHTSWPKS